MTVRLHKAGHPDAAEHILKRILWWGDRMPYWGDSFVANQIDYRKDTPLRCDIGGVAGAQAVIFGIWKHITLTCFGTKANAKALRQSASRASWNMRGS